MEFVLGLQQAEEDLDWVGFLMIMVITMVLVMVDVGWVGCHLQSNNFFHKEGDGDGYWCKHC